jgi:2-oxoglutarate dehydrogenase E2 component (dihydrolipoamide succinyltransferase)
MPAVPLTVPTVGESITEGILAKWLKPDGSTIKSGEPLYELETDKASNVVPAPADGVLKIQVPEGEAVAIGATVGTIDPDAAARPAADKPAAATPPQKPSPPAHDASANGGGGGGPASPSLSPAVRRVAAESGLDPSRIAPTGPGGRITKGDALAAAAQAPPGPAPSPETRPAPSGPAVVKPAPPTPPAESAPAGARETRRRMSGLRQRIAQRLVEVQQTAAILTTFNEADMTRVSALRAQYKESFQKKHGVGLGFSSFFIKATIEALKAFPAVNGRIEGNEIVENNYYDIGVAVSTEKGLMVPVIRDADRLSFAAIEKAIVAYATKAREGTISVGDLQGGTFTITNGGVFGSLLSTPILNPPQSAILGMHAIKKRPVVVDDQIAIRPMMYLALSYDHRIIDGREAVSFLVKIKDGIENPERLMLEV